MHVCALINSILGIFPSSMLSGFNGKSLNLALWDFWQLARSHFWLT